MKLALTTFSFTVALVASCSPATPSAKVGAELERHAAMLIECRGQGRAASDAGAEAGYSAYEACKAEAGIR